jgi:hypothetical protein
MSRRTTKRKKERQTRDVEAAASVSLRSLADIPAFALVRATRLYYSLGHSLTKHLELPLPLPLTLSLSRVRTDERDSPSPGRERAKLHALSRSPRSSPCALSFTQCQCASEPGYGSASDREGFEYGNGAVFS